MAPIVLIIGVVVILLWMVGAYNSLIALKYQVQNALKQIDVQLKRRHDLIPNLVQAVQGAMNFEKDTLQAVIEARNQAIKVASGADIQNVGKMAAAEGALTGALGRLMAVVESYPQLKANDNVKQLQEELTTTENKIAFARQFYNDSVNAYNNRRQSFPAVLAAASLGFGPIELFNMPEAEREVPKVALR